MSKELIFSVTKKDFDIQTFKSGGKGGQHQNKTDSGVRIIHRDSEAVGESRSTRSQHQNKRLALKRLVETPKFKLWLTRKACESKQKKSIDKVVDEQMDDKFLKIEVKENGKWVEMTEAID